MIDQPTRFRHEPSLDCLLVHYTDEKDFRVVSEDEVTEIDLKPLEIGQFPRGGLSAPLAAQIAVTPDCNLSCAFCYAKLDEGTAPMTDAQVYRLLDQLADHGVGTLLWAGGEPLMRESILDFLRYAHKRGFYQSMISNGTAFNDVFLAEAPQYLYDCQVSLDNIHGAYDRIKGGGFWEIFERGLDQILQTSVRVNASVVVTEENLKDLEPILHYLRRKGVPSVRLSWQVSSGKAAGASFEAYRKVMRGTEARVAELTETFGKGFISGFFEPCGESIFPREQMLCSAARSRIHFRWDGMAYPCAILNHPEFEGGNVLEQDLLSIWNSPNFQKLRDVTNSKSCRECRLNCSYWCRALVYSFADDVSLTPSPVCRFHGSETEHLVPAGRR